MATSSITHNFVINTTEGVERFARAIEDSEMNYIPPRKPKGRELTDPKEISAFMQKWKKMHE